MNRYHLDRQGVKVDSGTHYWFWGRDRLGLPWHLYLTENVGGAAILDAACGYHSPRTRDRQGDVPLPRRSLCPGCIANMSPTVARITGLTVTDS